MFPLMWLVTFLLNVSISAQEEEKSVPNIDYALAFEKLVKLGLPDTKGAKFVKLTLQAKARNDEEDYYESQYSEPGFLDGDGNAWLLPAAENETVRRLIYDGKIIEVTKKKKRGGLLRALVGDEKAALDAGMTGDWEEVDITKEIAKLSKKIEAAKGHKMFDPERWSYDNRYAKMSAEILVLACNLHRAGHEKEGNDLAQKILTLVPDPTRVIDAAVNELADNEYQDLAATFFKTKDWQAYRNDLSALTKKFPRGWNTLPGALILLPKLDKKISGAKPEVAKFKNVTLNPEALAILDTLLAREKPIRVYPQPLWLIVDPSKKTAEADDEYRESYYSRSAEEWQIKLCALGMDGFIALAAVAADDLLIPSPIEGNSSSDYYDGYRSSSIGDLETQALSAFDDMLRPCTRGEIARAIILATLPDADSELSNLPPDALRDLAYQWWLEHHDDSRSELARVFMENGDSSQRRTAVMALISSGKDEDAKLVEQSIMDAESLDSSITMVEPYLKARKGKPREFYVNYSKMLRDMVANGDADSLPWALREAGGIEKFLKRLSVHVDDISAEKIIAQMKSGKTNIPDGLAMLDSAMGDDFQTHLPDLVAIAAEQKKLSEQVALLQKLMEWSYKQNGGAYQDDDEQPSPKTVAEPKDHSLFLKSKADWQKLLTQTEKPKSDEEKALLNSLPSVAVYAAWTMETLYYPEHGGTLRQIAAELGLADTSTFILDRANQLLKDPATAEFPDPKKVTEDRRQAIRDEVTKLAAPEVSPYYQKLSLNEKLAWAEIIAGYKNKLPRSLRDIAKIIVKVDWGSGPDIEKSEKEAIEAIVLNKEFSERLAFDFLTHLAKNAERHASYLYFLNPSGTPGKGMSLGVVDEESARGWKGSVNEAGAALIRDEKFTAMAGIGALENSNWISYGIYLPAKNAPDNSDKIKEVIKNTLKSIDESTRFSIIFFTETATNLNKEPEVGPAP